LYTRDADQNPFFGYLKDSSKRSAALDSKYIC